jgi:hypothetical protein
LKPIAYRRRRGLTLTDVCCVLVTLVLLGHLLACVTYRAREQSDRGKCGNNLRQIALAAMMYANGEVRTGNFPRAIDDGVGGPPTAYTRWQAPNPFAGGAGAPGPNDVTAALFLLLRTQEITPDVFICPSVKTATAWNYGGRVSSPSSVSNFPGRQFLSYSYANPYPTPAAVKAGWKFNNSLGADYPLAADMNPGTPALLTTRYDASRTAMAAVNSPNHERDGQQVVYCDAHVEYQQTPYCGVPRVQANGAPLPYRDNIYTVGAHPSPTISAAPLDPTDMVLLPTVADGPVPPPVAAQVPGFRMLLVGGIVVIVLGGGVALTIPIRRSKRPPAGMQP